MRQRQETPDQPRRSLRPCLPPEPPNQAHLLVEGGGSVGLGPQVRARDAGAVDGGVDAGLIVAASADVAVLNIVQGHRFAPKLRA